MAPPSHPNNWPDAARALHVQTGDEALHPNVRQLLAGSQYRRVLVACSGGADSIFMLCQLWAQAHDLGLELVVAHYNHRWRGEDSQLDATFVDALAGHLTVPM